MNLSQLGTASPFFHIAAVVPQADGQVKIASSVSDLGLAMLPHPHLLQLDQQGRIDTQFGSDGKILIDVGTNPEQKASQWQAAASANSEQLTWFNISGNTFLSLRTNADGSTVSNYAAAHRGHIANLHPDIATYEIPLAQHSGGVSHGLMKIWRPHLCQSKFILYG